MKSLSVEIILLVVTLFAGIAANISPTTGYDKNNSYPPGYPSPYPTGYPTPYPTPYPIYHSAILKSIGINDGWILESSETSGKGGTLNSTATTFNLGDDLADRQYRAILHFDTSSLPDNAVITAATLKIKKQSQTGSNPFNILGELRVDIRKPAFGTAPLALADFKSAAVKSNVAAFETTPVGAWYSASLNSTGNNYINLSGTTQFRLRFIVDDNNDNGNDYMKFLSGNAGKFSRPQLVIEYYVQYIP